MSNFMDKNFRDNPEYKLAAATDSLWKAIEALTACLKTGDVKLVTAAYMRLVTCLSSWVICKHEETK